MLISNFNRFDYNLNHHTERINTIQKILSDGGIDYTDIGNFVTKLEKDTTVSFLDSSIRSIDIAINNYNTYDNVLQSMDRSLGRFRELVLMKESDATPNKAPIEAEMKSIIMSIKSLEVEKLNKDESLFVGDSDVPVGNNSYIPRTFGTDLIRVNGEKISDVLTNTSDLSSIDTVLERVNLSLTIVGMNTNTANQLKGTKELQKVYEEKRLADNSDYEGNLVKLNSQMKAYEAHMLMVSKMQKLSLVNYM